MKLYHATRFLDIINEFTPRIPENRFHGEDEEIPRICLASTIEGCLTAAPFGGSRLGENIDLPNGSSRLIRIYEFDTGSISKENIIKPDYLYQKDIVRDAEITGEHWITIPIKPTRTYLIKLTRYCDQYSEDDIAYEYVKLYESGEIEDISEYIEGGITVIDEIKYEIIPEERRSKMINLDNEIDYENGYENYDITTSILNEFPYSTRSYLNIEKRDGKNYIVGVIDTNGAEIDLNELKDVLNDILPDVIEIA